MAIFAFCVCPDGLKQTFYEVYIVDRLIPDGSAHNQGTLTHCAASGYLEMREFVLVFALRSGSRALFFLLLFSFG